MNFGWRLLQWQFRAMSKLYSFQMTGWGRGYHLNFDTHAERERGGGRGANQPTCQNKLYYFIQTSGHITSIQSYMLNWQSLHGKFHQQKYLKTNYE